MRTEAECHPQERFLFTDEAFSPASMSIWQRECQRRVEMQGLEKGEAFKRFISWEESSNEIALFTLYAYADFDVPKSFSCIFDLDNSENVVFTEFQLTQSIYEGWLPIESIEHGHKHLCIFKFEKEVPAMIQQLHVAQNKFSDVPKGSVKLGICDQADFSEIKKRRDYVKELRECYGTDWWKFDKENES